MATFDVRYGDIFDQDVEAIVNTVNCEGVMGKGLALQFKRRYPDNFEEYVVACAEGKVRPGRMFVHQLTPEQDRGQSTAHALQGRFNFAGVAEATGPYVGRGPRLIINFPTKDRWRRQSKLEYIEAGLEDLARVISEQQIRSIAVPALGCDLGGLDWQDVEPKIVRAMHDAADLRVVILEPRRTTAAVG